MRRAVFLDRDGVINIKKENGYVLSYDEFIFIPGAKEAIKILRDAGFLVIVITNQSVIGRGLIGEAELEAIHKAMQAELKEYGIQVDAIYFCPHHPDAGCECRKPAPKLIIDAAHTHKINLQHSYMIGDEDKDIEAGKRAGCKPYKVDWEFSLLDAALEILREDKPI